MAWPLLPLLCGTVAFLLPGVAPDTAVAQCGHPKAVANAHIDADTAPLNILLRYTCNPGYKRKAGTSTLIQCILPDGSTKPDWTPTTLECIRDPALRSQPPSPELPMAPHSERTTQRAGTSDASPASSPSPPATPRLPEPDGPTPKTSMPPLETSTLRTSVGTTLLPTNPKDHAAVSIKTVASSIGLAVLVVAGIVACCCWRVRMRVGQGFALVTAIPMVPPAAENEMLPPVPTG